MNLKEMYAACGGNYEEVMRRLPKESMVVKFVKRLPNEVSLVDLEQALVAGDVKHAFSFAHAMKGVCQNLNLDRLGNSSSALTEELRAGRLEAGKALLDQVKADYELTCKAISQLEE